MSHETASDNVAMDAWEAALSQAAFYVTDHCDNGGYHAEAIMGMPCPTVWHATKDAARLDWLEQSSRSFCGNYSGTGFRMIGSSIWHGTLREAIDGAMLEDGAVSTETPA